MLPDAVISHRTSQRLRIRIPSKRGDAGYFASLGDAVSSDGLCDTAEVNFTTGSILLSGKEIDIDKISSYAEEKRFFSLAGKSANAGPVASKVTGPMGELSGFIRKATKGQMDLANLAFLALICTGLYQILRGNLKSPPWYTAFWYAMGVFSKNIAVNENI
jgi:hypothetical protein